jgi:multiple sugar transport system substrate-binding protein
MIHQFEGNLLSADNKKSAVNSEAGLASAQILHDFVYKYQIAPKDTAPSEENTAFKAGTLTHVLHHLAMSNDFKGQTGLNLSYVALPRFGKKQAVYTNTHQLSIPMPSKVDENRIAGTLSFVRWLLADQGMEWAAAGQLPVKKSILESAEFKQKFDMHQGQIAMAPYVFFPTKIVKWSEVYSRIDPNLQALVLDQMTPQQTVAKMAQEMDEILAR